MEVNEAANGRAEGGGEKKAKTIARKKEWKKKEKRSKNFDERKTRFASCSRGRTEE